MFTNAEIQKATEAKAKAKAWADFKMKYPNADLSRFEVYVYLDKPSEIVFKHSSGVETPVSGSDKILES